MLLFFLKALLLVVSMAPVRIKCFGEFDFFYVLRKGRPFCTARALSPLCEIQNGRRWSAA